MVDLKVTGESVEGATRDDAISHGLGDQPTKQPELEPSHIFVFSLQLLLSISFTINNSKRMGLRKAMKEFLGALAPFPSAGPAYNVLPSDNFQPGQSDPAQIRQSLLEAGMVDEPTPPAILMQCKGSTSTKLNSSSNGLKLTFKDAIPLAICTMETRQRKFRHCNAWRYRS